MRNFNSFLEHIMKSEFIVKAKNVISPPVNVRNILNCR